MTIDTNAQDREWAALAAEGDQTAFTQLATRYRAYIHALAYKVTCNEEDALDVSQNVLIRLSQKIGEYKGSGAFKSWLAKITVREGINFLRRPGRREFTTDPQVLGEIIESGPSGGASDGRDEIDRKDRRAMVEVAMKELSAQQRAIMVLQLREGLGPKEIAAQLGLPASQVRTQLHRAVTRVREIIMQGQTGDAPGSRTR